MLAGSAIQIAKKGRRFRRPFAVLSKDLESQPKLTLKRAASSLCRNLAPRKCCTGSEARRVDIQTGGARLRVVQHVERVSANLKTLGLRESERLRQVRVEAPDRKSFDHVLTQVAALSRLRILENDQARVAAAVVERNGAGSAGRNNLRNRLQVAPNASNGDLRTDCSALRIGNFRPFRRIKKASFRQTAAWSGGSSPADARIVQQLLKQVCIHDVRNAIRVEHTGRGDVRIGSGA